jgi:hypothetical protein
VHSCCVFLPRLNTNGLSARGQVVYMLGTWIQNLEVIGSYFEMFGGTCVTASGGSFGAATVTNNAILHGVTNWSSGLFQVAGGGCFSDGSFSITSATAGIGGITWGSYAVTINANGAWYNLTGSTFVLKALLTTGTLKLGTSTNGASFTEATGVWSAQTTPITPAAIDAANGLQAPTLNARYCNTA